MSHHLRFERLARCLAAAIASLAIGTACEKAAPKDPAGAPSSQQEDSRQEQEKHSEETTTDTGVPVPDPTMDPMAPEAGPAMPPAAAEAASSAPAADEEQPSSAVGFEERPVVTLHPYKLAVQATFLPPCTPPTYTTDGRLAVPLVVTGYRDVNFMYPDDKVRYVTDASAVSLADDISSIRVEKGPNYVEGDMVQLFEKTNFGGRSIRLRPGEYRNLQDWSDGIASVRFLRAEAAETKECADVKPGDVDVWDKKIHIVATLFDQVDFGGASLDIIDDVWSLGDWALANYRYRSWLSKTSSIRLHKGPHYELGDRAEFSHVAGGGIRETLVLLPEVGYGGLPGEVGSLGRFNNKIESIYFTDFKGDRIDTGSADPANP